MISTQVMEKMIEYDSNDPKRIQHFLKVYEFAHLIGVKENIGEEELQILDIAALVHDIGIKNAEIKYGHCNGKAQEEEGPAEARSMLISLDCDQSLIDRVCYLVGHHHTYNNIEGIDYQILIEADFLVNIYEDDIDKDTIKKIYNNIFKTNTGKEICRIMYGL